MVKKTERGKILSYLSQKIKDIGKENNALLEADEDDKRRTRRNGPWMAYLKNKKGSDELNQARDILREVRKFFRDKVLISKMKKSCVWNVDIYYDEEFHILFALFLDDPDFIHYTRTGVRDGWHPLDKPSQMIKELKPKIIYFAHRKITSEGLVKIIHDYLCGYS